MNRTLLLILLTLSLLIPWGDASAGQPSLIPGTGIPVAPAPQATISSMPSPEEQEVLTAMNTVLALGTLSSELVAMGLDRAWWAANLEVTLHQIPYYLAEGREYDTFVDLVHPPTGDQTGCYARSGTTQWTCIDNWGPSSSYPVLSKPSDFVDSLFPIAWSVSGGAAGSSTQWDCMDLRAASGQADAVQDAGRMAGGLAAAGGAFAGFGALMGAVSATVATLGSVVAPAGMVLGAAVVAGASLALIGAGIVVAAVVAGYAARRAYEAGTTLGLATSCPGCGEGYDPQKWRCTSNPASDLCTCTPIDGNGGASDEGGNGSHGGSSGDSCTEHGGAPNPTIQSNPWDVTNYSDASGCTETETHSGLDNAACESCVWYTPPEDMEPASGGSEGEGGTSYGCDVCVAGDSPSMGEVTCWTISWE